jgi:hypothetical protein
MKTKKKKYEYKLINLSTGEYYSGGWSWNWDAVGKSYDKKSKIFAIITHIVKEGCPLNPDYIKIAKIDISNPETIDIAPEKLDPDWQWEKEKQKELRKEKRNAEYELNKLKRKLGNINGEIED